MLFLDDIMKKLIFFSFLLVFLLAEASYSMDTNLTSKSVINEGSYLPPQCYTVTKGENGEIYNPCYSCHTDSREPNYTNDSELQESYDFAEYLKTNRWKNLFTDKTERVAEISDKEILDYIRTNNYIDENGQIVITNKLKNLPSVWDYNKNGVWDGYMPDCYFSFDKEGFDRAPDGSYTGWRAFAYAPFLGTFWPTNGSADDVLIRLSEIFRKDENGNFDITVYKINMAVVEAMMLRADVAVDPVDERHYGVDLDRNGLLGTATKVVYKWAPLEGIYMSFAGAARIAFEKGEVHIAAGLFPEGTEFLHSVRYLDIKGKDDIALAPRMKELRYAKKKSYKNYTILKQTADEEMKEKYDFPDRLTEYYGDMEKGISNFAGWSYQGFIEDAEGELRPQTYEENIFCMGCHTKVGITSDSNYSFTRKFDSDSFQRGWYHWSQKYLKGTPEPKAEYKGGGVQYEYSLYLMYNRAGDEFRANEEVMEKFFNKDGTIKEEMLNALHDDMTVLVFPSKDRALNLNKAYKVIVENQSFIFGRDANVKPVQNVHKYLQEKDFFTGITEPLSTMRVAHSFDLKKNQADEDISALLKSEVLGSGMTGPDGKRYGIDWKGVISRSTYGISNKNIHFTFPDRLTLPTRALVANGSNKSCYVCHRLSAPVPSDNPKADVPLTLTKSKHTFSEDKKIYPITNDKGFDTTAAWSPDGEKIAYTSDTDGKYDIWIVNADGKGKKKITSDRKIHGWAQWSPDSSKLVFWSHDNKQTSYIQSADISSGKIETLLKSDEDINRPVFSPDGQYIAYSAVTDGNWDVWVMTSDGRKNYRLTSKPDMESNPIWSPDGSALAYKVAPMGEYGLTVEHFLTFENGFEKQAVYEWNGPQAIQMSDWSNDGKKIAYTAEVVTESSGKDRVSYKIIVSDYMLKEGKAGSNPVVLSHDFTLGDRSAQFSPDSSRVIFWAWDKNYRSTLWAADADGRNLEQLTRNGYDYYPMWSPDGSKVVFESNRNGTHDLWIMELD